MIRLRNLAGHTRSVFQIRRHFRNPWLLVLFRLGLLRTPYFLHEVFKDSRHYQILARPSTTSMADLFVLREVLVDEAYGGILPLLRNGPVRLVDVGANLGSFTIWLHKRVGIREAYCFEPEPDSYRLLRFNLSLNNCSAAQPIECAVGGEERTIRIALKKNSPGGTSIYADESEGGEARRVRVVAFESWLGGLDGDFDLVKIDCEGAEWEILRNTARAQFARFKILVAEVHADPTGRHGISEFSGLAESVGFRTVRWDNRPLGQYIGVQREIS